MMLKFVATSILLRSVVGESLPQYVADWTEQDVELWWNRTLFPEHVSVLRDYGVDGPTLLGLPPEEAGIAFLPNHPLQAAKIQGHIAKLQDRCLCPQSNAAPSDFWSYADTNRNTVFRLGSTAMYLPRGALLYTNFLDHDTWDWLMNTNVGESSTYFQSFLFWITTLVAPYFLLAYGMLGAIWTNPIFITPLLLSVILQQLSEYLMIFGVYMQYKASKDGKAPAPDAISTVKMFFPVQCAIPVVAFALSFILPWILVQLCLWAMMLHSILQCVAVIVTVVGGMFEAPARPPGGESAPAGAEKPKDK